MASVWEFIKRHRGKLILSGVVVGGIYAGKKLLLDNSRLTQFESPFSIAGDSFSLESRKHYIFDSNQRTCDSSVIQLVPSLKSKLQKRYDIEILLDSLKNGGGGGQSGDKIKIWQDMKLMSFVRLIGTCYSFTLLIVSLKLQISIIAADIYEKSLEKSSTSVVSNILEKVGGWFDGTSSVKQKPAVDASTQQIFLQALHYFITQGSSTFVDKIETIISEVLKKISLKDELTFEQFQQVFVEIRAKIAVTDCSTYSMCVVPLMTTNQSGVGGSSTPSQLDELLVLLKTLLDSAPCNEIVNYCLDEFFNRVFDSCRHIWFADQDYDDEQISKKVPMAKIIPMVSDCFHHVSQTDFDSIVHILLVSSPLHEFCVKVFEKDSNLW